MATTLVLAVTSGSAEAIDFRFSDLSVSNDVTVDGIFRFDSDVVPSASLNQADLLDWEITISNASTSNTTILYGDGGGFGADNSDIASFPTGLSANNLDLTFGSITSGSLCITEDGTCFPFQGFFNASATQVRAFDADGGGTLNSSLTASVPFELSPTLGLLMVGGIYGVSRLRQSRKSLEK